MLLKHQNVALQSPFSTQCRNHIFCGEIRTNICVANKNLKTPSGFTQWPNNFPKHTNTSNIIVPVRRIVEVLGPVSWGWLPRRKFGFMCLCVKKGQSCPSYSTTVQVKGSSKIILSPLHQKKRHIIVWDRHHIACGRQAAAIILLVTR